MNDSMIESMLRAELKRNGERWGNMYKHLSDEQRIELLGKLEARRKISEEREALIRRNLENEPDEKPDGPTCGTLQSGTGGGKRVILKGSPFS
jgi:hypothetical protein